MFYQNVFYLLFCLVSISSCNVTSPQELYADFLKEVVKLDELKSKLEENLSGSYDDLLVVLKMLDAGAKFPTGLLGGNFYNLGNWDECYNIEYNNLFGKYCLGMLSIPNLPLKYHQAFGVNNLTKNVIIPQSTSAPMPVPILLASCVFSNTRAEDLPGLVKFSEGLCSSKATEPELSNGAIATIVVLSVVLGLCVVSTVLDIFLLYSKKEAPHEVMLAFSFVSNGRKLLTFTNNSDQILCLNGIRALSMMWVILGHLMSSVQSSTITNVFDAINFSDDPANMYVLGGTVSVDTFFAIGGLVTVYTFLKAADKGVKFNIILFYIHRYLRLTPAYGIVILFYSYLFSYLSNGPLWSVTELMAQSCHKNWWSSILYITNYVKDGTCLGQAWYLTVDMQLFILSPLVLIPLSKWPKYGLYGLGCLSILGCVVPFAVRATNDFGNLFINNTTFMDLYYSQTYARFGPYVIGMIAGYYIYQLKKTDQKIQLSSIIVLLTWLICLATLVACVYAGYPLNDAPEDKWGNAIFLAFNRPAWAVAVSVIIYLCVAGYGGPIDNFLSAPVFQFLSKLSYSMFLVHIAVIQVRTYSLKTSYRFSTLATFHTFWGDFMFTLFISLLLCLAFESPIIILEKFIFGKGTTHKKHQEKI